MFASAASRNASNAYRSVGMETSVSSASPHRLVAMLFDGLSDALARARGAMQAGQIAEKGRAIGHAVRIVEEGLRSSLNLDDGGAVAADLNRLYGYVTLRLTHANLHNDPAALQECSDLIEPVRSAWLAIDPARAGVAR
jgi:flagellar protein FliS